MRKINTVLASLALLLAALPWLCPPAATAGVYQVIDMPGALSTSPMGISGKNIVGWYQDASSYGVHGFLYNDSQWTTLNPPGSPGFVSDATGVSGDRIVGWYFDAGVTPHGYLYESGSWTPIEYPNAVKGTYAMGISGDIIAGNYLDGAGHYHGFTYENGAYSPLPEIAGFHDYQVRGISGNTIVGNYTDASSVVHGFVYNGNSYATLDVPGATGTVAYGASGPYVVGTSSTGGFLHQGTSWTSIDGPYGNGYCGATGISGGTIVGYASTEKGTPDSSPPTHGFILTHLNQITVPVGGTGGQSVSAGGGISSAGGVVTQFANVTATGSFTVEYALSTLEDMENGSGPFGVGPSDFDLPLGSSNLCQIWDLGYSGAFSDSVTLTFAFDPTGMPFGGKHSLCVYHYTDDQWVPLDGTVDLVANTITVTTDSFSPFALGRAMPEPASLLLLAPGGLAMLRRRG